MGVAGSIIGGAAIIGSSVSTGYRAGQFIGEAMGEAIRDKSLILTSKHRHRIWAGVMYKNNYIEDWMVTGWFEIIPLDSFCYSFPDIRNRVVYYCALYEECSSTWGKVDTTGYIPTINNAFTNYYSSCIGELWDFSRADLSDNDIQRELTGY